MVLLKEVGPLGAFRVVLMVLRVNYHLQSLLSTSC
jgi:hypothetical protein